MGKHYNQMQLGISDYIKTGNKVSLGTVREIYIWTGHYIMLKSLIILAVKVLEINNDKNSVKERITTF